MAHSEESTSRTYFLGLDIGSTSVGWACVEARNGQPVGVLAAGVRQFSAGMTGNSLDFDRGKEESNAIARRTARLVRRQFRRRASRRWNVFRTLQTAGLLPTDPVQRPTDLSAYIEKLDAELRPRYCNAGDHQSAQLLVYRIRATAATQRVDPFDLGRAFLHLAKRRGFNSNLRGVPRDDEETGTVKPAIRSLASQLTEGDRTLGQFLATQNPFEKGIPHKGVRRRWTGREMYQREFDQIWRVQRQYHPKLTEELYKSLSKAIFYQRPIRSAKGLVGKCSLEPKRRRLAAAHPLAQEVRMLQFVNNCRVRKRGELERPLDEAEREQALNALTSCGRMKLKDFRAAIRLPKGASLNFAGDDDDHACGLGTVSSLRGILGDRWDCLSVEDQERLFYEVLSFNKADALIRRAQRFWGFTEQQAKLLSELTLEPGYSRHCRVALEKLREVLRRKEPGLARWPTYAEAKQVAYPEAGTVDEACEFLPPVLKSVNNVTNPAVIRALTEVRKVVNELMRRFGKPDRVCIELARELKRSKKERKRYEDVIKEQTDKRRKALKAIREEFTAYPEKRGYDRGIEAYLLAEECNWICPYTEETIHGVRDLIGDNSRFDVEHIYPRRYLDDSFGNKTLCLHEENRHVKRDRLPAIAYADNPRRYAEILERVKKFKGTAATKKLARFMDREVPADFSSRQLNETRYMSVAAADYLALLFGGRVDSEGRQRVYALTGGLTSILRGQWKLNQILGIADEKNRADHRQHAVDAIVIACTHMGTVAKLESAAEDAWRRGSPRAFPEIDPPWPGFFDDARRAVLSVIVSHRQDRRLNGPLHADTNYAPPILENGKAKTKVRKLLEQLSEGEIAGDAIVDEIVRKLVQSKFAELKQRLGASKKAKDVFASLENHPRIPNRDGTFTPIHSVRVWVKAKPFAVNVGQKTRFVAATGGSNFCTRILAVEDEQGNEVGWTDELISRRDAMRMRNRRARHQNERFTLFIHEHVLMADNEGKWQVYRVVNLSEGDIEIRLHHDGRTSDELKKAKERVRIGSGALARRCFRKIAVSPTGQITDAVTNEAIDLSRLAKPLPAKQTANKRNAKGKSGF